MKLLNPRKKLVSVAIASAISGGAMLMAAPAQAMNVSQDNVGEVLLFPYYTVKNGYDTVFTVTNTTNKTAVFKIRFREALNSRETRDFNVILSPNDHWNGAVTIDGTDGALIRTYDKTCTSPMLPGMATDAARAADGAKGEVAMTNALFSGKYKDGASEAMSRVQEGYFEVILMGVSDLSTSDPANVLEYNAKHVNNVPRSCTKVDELFLDVTQLNYLTPPENVLKGHVTYINVASGKAIDAEPTAIENFANLTNIIAAPGDVNPDLSDGDDFAANMIVSGVPQTVNSTTSEDTVTNLLQAQSIVNEYASGTGASTSWVVTFPTKHHYTDAYTSSGTLINGGPLAPFSEWFYNGAGDGKSCDNIGVTVYNREENGASRGGTDFSPAPEGSTVELCYEANVIDFNTGNVFGSGTNRLGIATADIGTSGWARLSFTEDAAAVDGLNGMYGLPVIGFAAMMRDSGGATVNYGSSTEHTTERTQVAPQ